jgi:hypothetical protein
MSETVAPPSFDECPPQMTGGLIYAQGPDGRWYAMWNSSTGEMAKWPSNASLGIPEAAIPPLWQQLHAAIVVKGHEKFAPPDAPVVVEACP